MGIREAAWTVLLVVAVVFVVLVAIEVGRRSRWRSPVDVAADLFTRPDVRNETPVPTMPPTSPPVAMDNGAMDLAS